MITNARRRRIYGNTYNYQPSDFLTAIPGEVLQKEMALGGYGKAEAILQQSISTFRKVLEIRKRDTEPLLWAQTANNLGAACFALAKQSQEEHLLEEASYYFQGAVQVYRKVRGQKKKAEVIQKNLMRVQQLLSENAA